MLGLRQAIRVAEKSNDQFKLLQNQCIQVQVPRYCQALSSQVETEENWIDKVADIVTAKIDSL